MKAKVFFMIMLSFAFLIVNGQKNQSAGNLNVGIGVVDISGEDAVILDPLHVKAVLFSQGEEQVILIECDVTGIPDDEMELARKKVSTETGIPYNRVCVSATHTHMANSHKELVPAIVQAANEAKKDLKHVKLFSEIGQEFNVPFNRRYYMKDGSVVFNPMFLNPDIVRAAGPIDPDIGFLLMKDASSNTPVASITNYALHLDIVKQYGAKYQKEGVGSQNSVSADYPYWLEENLKNQFGQNFKSIFFTGSCGNINHWDFSKPGPQSGHKTKSKEVGDSLYQAINRVLPHLKENSPTLAVRSQTLNIPLQSFTKQELGWAQNVDSEKLSSKSEVPDERQQFLENVKRRKILWLNEQKLQGKTSIPIDILAIKLSKTTAIVTFPGEMFVEHGMTLKNFSPFKHTLVVELTNSNDVKYIPNKTAFKQGGYEVVNSRLVPGGGEMVVDAAVKMLNELNEIH